MENLSIQSTPEAQCLRHKPREDVEGVCKEESSESLEIEATPLEVIQYPDERLESIAEEIDFSSPDFNKTEIEKLVEAMKATAKKNEGAGLAATQIGVTKRIIIFKKKNEQFASLINPKIINEKREAISRDEGCLSVLNSEFRTDVPRFKKITVQGFNAKGRGVTIKLSGFPAFVVQHEVDHLNGKDKVADAARKAGKLSAEVAQFTKIIN